MRDVLPSPGLQESIEYTLEAQLQSLHRNPPGWHEASQPHLRRFHQGVALRASGDLMPGQPISLADIRQHVAQQRDESWQEIAEIPASETKATIIIPIHNEEAFLPSLLNTLDHLILPSNGEVNILFITNGCTDNGKSEAVVEQFLSRKGTTSSYHLNHDFSSIDPHINSTCTSTQEQGISYTHISTSTASKTNALALGTELAHSAGHKIAICLDANTFPEPNAIANLFGQAHREIAQEEGAVVMSGIYKDHTEPGDTLMGMTPREALPSYIGHSKGTILVGALMAWDVQWWREHGGIPQVISDDTAMRIHATVHGRRVGLVPEAKSWRYAPSTIADRATQLVRYVRAAKQLRELGPEYADIIDQTCFYTSEEALMEAMQEWAQGNPLRQAALPQVLSLWKDIMAKAEREYAADPFYNSWDDISGTK